MFNPYRRNPNCHIKGPCPFCDSVNSPTYGLLLDDPDKTLFHQLKDSIRKGYLFLVRKVT